MRSYISRIRERIGRQKLIHPAARILIENESGEVLFVEKNHRNGLGIPAGALEESETIKECILREVKEETGIEILEMEVIGISSSPGRETVIYPNGDLIQYFTVEFYSRKWKGDLAIQDTKEIKRVFFKDKSYAQFLPPNERTIFDSLQFFEANGTIRVD
ncbi:MAG: NUDIX domain-containing protein [Bacteroidota bacterium]